jgi:hypothetical protein
MDDAVGGLVALAELVGALVAFIIEVIILCVELLVLLVELLIWGIAALMGRKGQRPQRRQFHRPSRLKGSTRRGLSYLIVFGGIGLFFAGRGIYHRYFTAELQLRGALGMHASAVEVEWCKSSGEIQRDSIDSPTRYLRNRWTELRIIDESYQAQTIRLTQADQSVQLESRLIEKLVDASIDKLNTTASENIDPQKVGDFLKKKVREAMKAEETTEPP